MLRVKTATLLLATVVAFGGSAEVRSLRAPEPLQSFKSRYRAALRAGAQPQAQAPPADSLDGGAQPDPDSGRGANPMKQMPVIGSQFEVNPVSSALKCVVSLTVQYMLVYTALAIFRTLADCFGTSLAGLPLRQLLKVLATAALTVNYAPMLAVLFLGVRMRVLWLTQGKGNAPEWMQMCMYMCTYAVLMMTLSVCIIPIFTGEASVNVDGKTGDIKQDCEPFQNRFAAICFTVLKYTIMVFLYGGVVAICWGLFTYEPSAGSWPGDATPPVSAASTCVMLLSVQFFLVYAAVQASRTFTQFTGVKTTKFESVMLTATNAMNFAPMLAILFLAARMRALQMDPIAGSPQPWAQKCFYFCTYGLIAQTLLAIAVPFALSGGEARPGGTEGDMHYEVDSKMFGMVLTAARYAIMLSIYVGISCVIFSILTLQHPAGVQFTPPISATMKCVIILTVQFFLVYLGIWVGVTLKEFSGGDWDLGLLTDTMESARGTIMFCPMLAILFVGTRMRALHLSSNRGAPQGYAQDGMYCATWAVLLQFLMCLVVPLCTGKAARLDEDGNVKWRPGHPVALYAVSAVKWVGLLLMYGGVVTVMVAIFTMTPENANGRGSLPLVRQTPFGNAPPGVSDLPMPNS